MAKKDKKKIGRPAGEPTTTYSVRHTVKIINDARLKNPKLQKEMRKILEKSARK